MRESKTNQNRPTNNDEEAMQATSERQPNEETKAQNDGFRYDYDDSSDL